MRAAHRVLVCSCMTLLAASIASAQVVNGLVVLPDGSTPVPGTIVMALDAGGATIVRGLTTARGTFVLKLPAPGTVDFRLLRIGYKPLKGPSVTLAAGETKSVKIIYDAATISLAAMNVRERETCRVQADSGLMVASLWEEARKAMLTSQLSSDDVPLFAEWIEYDRTLDSTSLTVRKQRVRTSRNPTTHAFRSVNADILKTSGYVVLEGDATNYYAPDAEVLLSDSFVASHCFRVVLPPRGDDQARIGVAFVPTRERSEMKEIEGTLWIDRASAELRSLEFKYTNLPDAASRAKPGGVIDFLRLGDGNWLVHRWVLRMPEMGVRQVPSVAALRAYALGNRLFLRAVQVAGGEVVRATRRDTLVYQGTGAAITVQVVARDRVVAVAGARLDLEGTDYTAVANANGVIRMSPVLAGRYVARVHTPMMDSIGMPPIVREVETRMDAQVDSLLLPAAKDIVAVTCPKDSVSDQEGMLHGWLKDERARPIAHGTITVNWKSNFSQTNGQLAFNTKSLGAVTDNGGYWRACGVPKMTPLSVSIVSDSGSDSREVRLDDEPFAEVTLVLHKVVATAKDLASATSAPRPRAQVELDIADTRGTALADATLEILPVGGTPIIVVTGPSGRAIAADVPPGVITVRTRRIGYMEGVVSATVKVGRNTVPIVMSAVSTPTLDTMRVVGDRVTRGRLGEFEQRRLDKSATASFTRDDILKRNPTAIWQMLTNVPAVNVTDGFSGDHPGDYSVVAKSNRGQMTRLENSKPCYYLVMVDGVPQAPTPPQEYFDLRQLPHPDQIHGVEIFAGPASIPLQYGGTGSGKWCGLIAVWTR